MLREHLRNQLQGSWKENVNQPKWTSKDITQKTGLSEENPEGRMQRKLTRRNLQKWDKVREGGDDVYRGRARLRPDPGWAGRSTHHGTRRQPGLPGLPATPNPSSPALLRRSRERLRLRSSARAGGAARAVVSWPLLPARDLLLGRWGRGSLEAGA